MMSIREYLQGRHVWFETLLYCPAPTATKRAHSIHVPGRSVAKVVLISTAQRELLAVLPATHRIDLDRLARVLGDQEVRIATEDEVRRVFTNCELGALPPFGRLYGLKTVVDVSLDGRGDFIFPANTRHEGMRMHFRDYATIEAPIRARFATSASPRRRRESHRRAG